MDTTQTSHLNLLTGASVDDATADAGGCCGGGSCMCSMDSSAANATSTATDGDAAATAPASTAGTEFLVTGMTCGHCVSSVTEEVGAIVGVDAVEVVLKKGGASRVTVTSASPVDADAVRKAVEEAGYQLV